MPTMDNSPHRRSPAAPEPAPIRVGSAELRARLAELLSDVKDRGADVVVTRNGRPAAALIPIGEYEALEETADILSDADAVDAIEAGMAELGRGETVTFEFEELRDELAERRNVALTRARDHGHDE